jgi:hypothetical protein
MSSAAKAKLGALYINACEAVPQHQLLEEMGHPQPPTLMQTDNSTTLGVVTSNIQPQCTKAMGMRFHWLQCHEAPKQFGFFWRPGKTNLANYWTKHHCNVHHIKQHPQILTPKTSSPLCVHQNDAIQCLSSTTILQPQWREQPTHYITNTAVMKGCARHPVEAYYWEYGIPT